MTKKQLVKIIQEVVRREIKKEINEIFINEQKTSTQKLDGVDSTFSDFVPQASEPKKQVKYTNNKSLNDVLNETVGLSKKQDSEYPTMGGGTFDTSRMTELLGYGQTDEVKRDMVAVDTIKKAGKSVDQVPDHVTSALTKDYSALMKALDKKKQGGLG